MNDALRGRDGLTLGMPSAHAPGLGDGRSGLLIRPIAPFSGFFYARTRRFAAVLHLEFYLRPPASTAND